MNDELDNVMEYVKEFIGVDSEDTGFNVELLGYINAAMSSLNRLGVGEWGEVLLVNKNTSWTEIFDTCGNYEFIKTYVALKTKRIFENQTSSIVNKSMDDLLQELEFNIRMQLSE